MRKTHRHVGLLVATLLGVVFLPLLALAADPIQIFFGGLVMLYFASFINNSIIPLIFALSLLFFIYAIFRYFFYEGDSADSKKKAQDSALWGIIGLVFMVSIWGIVNAFVGGIFGATANKPVTPDYIESQGGGNNIGEWDTRIVPSENFTNPPLPGRNPGRSGDFGENNVGR